MLAVPLSELARTLALLDREAEPHKVQKATAENALTKLTTRKKAIIKEIEKRGSKILDEALGQGEFDLR